jgi:Organic Anion Transporter Polypeptide (OATP) family
VLCSTLNANLTQTDVYEISTLVLLFVVQLTIAMANVAFYCLGLSYMDDNCREHESAALIAGAVAAKYWGGQLGLGVSVLVTATSFGWWFGWALLAPLLFLTGFFIALFPKRLPSTVVRLAANSIIETATSSQLSLPTRKLLADITFFPSFWRLLCNKILMFNVIATVFLETAIVNFLFHETNYLQSRFFLPSSEADGINNEWMSRVVTTFLLKPPLVALSILVAGLIIAKANPSAR